MPAPGPVEGFVESAELIRDKSEKTLPTVDLPQALAQARMQKGMDIALVSSRLRLGQRQIVAMENGDWAQLPGRTFVRAALRSYGRLLEVDVEPLLAAIDSSLPGNETIKPMKELRRPMPRQDALGFSGSGSGSRWVWLVLLVGGIAALAFFYGGGPTLLNRNLPAPGRVAQGGATEPAQGAQSSPSSTTSKPEVQSSTPSAQPVAPAQSSAPVPAPVSVAPSNPTMPAAGTGTVSPAAASGPLLPLLPPAGSAPASAGTAATPSASGQSIVNAAGAAGSAQGLSSSSAAPPSLLLRFAGESWIEVRDPAGNVLAIGTQPAGTSREFRIDPPVSLTIGNAPAAAVTWRGTPIDLGPHMRQGVARLRIE